jgi:histidine triad (HIT) family protein
MPSIFSRIIAGELPGNFVWKDPEVVGLMTIQPFKPGHVLVIPRQEIDHWDEMPEPLAAQVMHVSQRIARALKSVYHPLRVGVMVAGLEVPHAHVHIVPIDDIGELSFARARNAQPAELAKAAADVRAALRRMGFTAEAAD